MEVPIIKGKGIALEYMVDGTAKVVIRYSLLWWGKCIISPKDSTYAFLLWNGRV